MKKELKGRPTARKKRLHGGGLRAVQPGGGGNEDRLRSSISLRLVLKRFGRETTSARLFVFRSRQTLFESPFQPNPLATRAPAPLAAMPPVRRFTQPSLTQPSTHLKASSNLGFGVIPPCGQHPNAEPLSPALLFQRRRARTNRMPALPLAAFSTPGRALNRGLNVMRGDKCSRDWQIFCHVSEALSGTCTRSAARK